MTNYAIIRVGGKQYRVREGERLLVDRLKADEGATVQPDLLFVPDGDGKGVTVTARVVEHVRGEKLRIGKYKKRTGYKRHTGFRAALTQIEIESIGGKARAAAKKPEPAAAKPGPVAEAEPAAAPKAAKQPAAATLPTGYEDMKVSEVAAGAKEWDRATLEGALAYERDNANRKGAVSALESALAKEKES